MCEQLAQGCYVKAQSRESNTRPSSRKSSALTVTPAGHQDTVELSLSDNRHRDTETNVSFEWTWTRKQFDIGPAKVTKR